MSKERSVERPLKKTEYKIVFASRQAEKGWRDLRATQRNALVEAWEFLTKSPTAITATNYPLKGQLGTVTRDGVAHTRWQHKPSSRGGARIWFFVVERRVYLENVHTSHPNETK